MEHKGKEENDQENAKQDVKRHHERQPMKNHKQNIKTNYERMFILFDGKYCKIF